MAQRKPLRLFQSPLTKRVYAVRNYADHGSWIDVKGAKEDVTDDFRRLAEADREAHPIELPQDLQALYDAARAFRRSYGSKEFVGAGTVEVLIERIGRAERAAQPHHKEREEQGMNEQQNPRQDGE